ncbi:MAG: CAP domain-containing protein [Bacteroidales bacterium]|nr:CAP domain-containing protein [Bacteroidales bacterium]MBN2761912.1 CAP domain-containing protein [Bacteroidales bacterium]
MAFSQNPDYYQNLDLENYRLEKSFNDTLDFNKLDLSRLNAILCIATNEIRVKHKLPALEYSPELEKAAVMHSRDMVVHNFFSHTNPVNDKRKTPNDRAGLTGITNPFLAENIAEDFGLQYESGRDVYVISEGNFSYRPEGKLIQHRTYLSLAESLMERWMSSSEHRKNILSPHALQIGCGTYFFIDSEFNGMPTFMATQNFQWYEKVKLLQQ